MPGAVQITGLLVTFLPRPLRTLNRLSSTSSAPVFRPGLEGAAERFPKYLPDPKGAEHAP